MVNYNINNQACDSNTNKEINLLKNSKYFESIDLYGSKTDISISASNIAAQNSSDNSDRLSILKYLEIYKSIKLDFSKVENNFIFQKIDLINKIYKL